MTQIAVCDDVSVSTLADRIAWILEHRGFKSGRALSVASGLSPSTINNQIMRERDRNKDDGEAKSKVGADAETLAKVAAVACVRLEWLTTGQGDPEETTAAPVGLKNPDVEPDVLLKVYDDLCNPKKFREGYERDLVRYALNRQRWRHNRAPTYDEVLWNTKEEIDMMLEKGEWPLKGNGQ